MVLTAAYNAASSRTQLKGTIASTLDFQNDYTYDNLQRQTKVEQVGQTGGNTVANKRLSYAYNAASFLTSVVRDYKPSGTWTEVATTAYTLDDLDRTTGIDHKKAGTSLFTPYAYTYDRIDRITGITTQNGTVTYAYDPTSQLTSADYSYQTDQSFSFDANGNWNMSGYSIGTNNQMTSDGVYNYLYDDEGNLTKRTKISDSSYTEYGWDHRQRLTSLTNRNSSHTILSSVAYVYDALNRRVQKSFDADGSGGSAAVPTNFVYDVSGTSVLLEFGGSSNLLRRNLWAEPLDQLLAVENSSNATTWGLSDISRTVRDVIDNLAAVQNHIKWDANANVTFETASAVDYLMGFGGMVRDEETGLSYAWNRYQGNGHWLSPDPKGFGAGDPNLQRVTGNDFINKIDPSGLEGEGGMPFPRNYTETAQGQAAYAAWFKEQYGESGSAATGWTLGDYAASGAMLALNPLGWAMGAQWGDGVLAVQHPIAYTGGGMTGLFHGQTMVWNAATMGLITPLDGYVNDTIAANGGNYGAANFSANIGVSAAIAALPCGPVTNTFRALEYAASTRDIYLGYQNGDMLQMAGGVFGVGSGALGNWCFVAGTQVVVRVETPTNPLSIASEAADFDAARVGGTMLFVGLGVAAFVSSRPRRKKTTGVGAIAKGRTCSTSGEASNAECEPIGVEQCHTTDEALLAIVACENRNPGKVLERKAAQAATVEPRRENGLMQRLGLIGLAASLLIAGGIFFGFSDYRASQSSAQAGSATHAEQPKYVTKNIEDLSVNDEVLAWNEITGRQSLQRVDRTYRRVADHLRILTIRSVDGQTQTLKTTNEHPFWVPSKGWINAGELALGERLLAANGSIATIAATDYEPHPEGMPVFNLRVVGDHTYYAAESSSSTPILVHNADYGPFGSTSFGQFMHDSFPAHLQGLFPNTNFLTRVTPGQTGVDASVIGGVSPGFLHAELKLDTTSGIITLNQQLANWQLPDVAVFLYNANGDIRLGGVVR